MGSQLHQALRNLCFNTGWNYAVFWKLKHQAQMVLNWEDAYYDSHEQCEPSENKWFGDIAGNSYNGHLSHDSLGLAVAKMSYHVYALGEGIVGQVAVTGKHLWISANKHAMESCSLLEYSDGWLTQFSAGIMTIVVVAVVPHGVVQLGSFNNIAEDLKLVNHVRDFFFKLQDEAGHISRIDSSSCLSNVSTRSSASQNYHDSTRDAYKNMKNQKTNIWSPVFQSLEKPVHHSYSVPLPEVYPRKMKMINNNGPPEYSVLGVGESTDLLQSSSMDTQKQVYGKLTIDRKSEGETSGMRDVGVGSEDDGTPSSLNFCSDKSNLYNVTLPTDNYEVNISCLPSVFHGTAPSINQNGILCAPEISHDSQASTVKTLEFQTEINHMDACKTWFSSGCELYEALGPSFKKQNTNCDWKTQKRENGTVVSMSDEGTSSSNLLTVNPGMEYLLEAMVTNVCHSVSEVKCENPTSGSVKSLLTAEKELKPSASDTHTIGSAGYSYDQSSLVEDSLHCLASSGTCGFRSSKGFSSASSSRCSEQLERPQEQAKISKKRARPGENCRPRPRDRQLIQDHIKELRELVPNGSKCSIDSLLERTIKHMLFMQCTSKHADKLDKCAESKLFDKKIGVHGSSSFEQGSSWAMEVENHSGVFPIMVQNINMNGQMLVEVLCEDCNHFFEIAEAIRNLGLTILKGATEAYDEKIWMCFVVEGQNNRNTQRMDILWSLVQILQPKTEV